MSDSPREQDPTLGGKAVDQSTRAIDVVGEPEDDDVVATMRRQLEEFEKKASDKDAEAARERAAREAAERAAREAAARAREAEEAVAQARDTSQRSVDEANLASIGNALAAHNSKMDTLESDYAAANSEGDFQKAAKIHREMAVLGGTVAQLTAGKEALEERIKTPPRQPPPRPDQPSAEERKEAFIRSQPARVQDWLRSDTGTRFFTDEGFRSRVAKAADFAQSVKGIPIDSPQYIDFIESELGLRPAPQQQEQRQAVQQEAAAPRGREADQRPRMTTAPAGGATGGAVRSNPDGSRQVYLSKDERDMADRMGIPHAEYARNKAQLLDEGLIGPGVRSR